MTSGVRTEHRPPARGGWSLARSIRRQIVLAVAAPVVVAVAIGYLFLRGSVAREIQALVEEELNEATLRLPAPWEPERDFPAIAARCQAEHPGYPMAWRVFDSRSGEVLGEFGERSLLGDQVPRRRPLLTLLEISGWGATQTITVDAGRSLGIVLDGSAFARSIRIYLFASVGVLASCLALAWISGRVSSRRIHGLFARVADDIDRGSPAGEDLAVGARLPLEIRDVARRLQEALDHVRRTAEESRVFTMGMAHELRSPVQNLIGRSEVALMKPRDEVFYERLITDQVEELMQFSDSIDNVLTYCSEPALGTERTETFELADEAQVRLSRERERGARKGVQVVISHRGETRMRGDREALLRGLRNVVANAVDWTPSGGNVAVAISGHGESVCVVVDDEGPGVPVELHEKVFEPFYQGPSIGGRRVGYGLGLAMTKKTVESQSGRIRIETSPGGGARFVIEMDRHSPIRM
jgi:signal transduction histidine kinase